MAWLSSNTLQPSDSFTNDNLNNLANDIRQWGGNVNGGGYTLFNANISGVFNDPTTTVGDLIVHGPSGTPGVPGSLQRLPIGASNGLALVVDSTQPLGLKWGVAAGGLVDPTTAKGDLIVRGASGPPTRLPLGLDTQLLIADSSQPLGMRWGTITGFAAPGSDTQVMINHAGLPGAASSLAYNYTLNHVLIGGQPDDGSAAVLQVAGQVHTTMRVRCDQFFSAKTYPASTSLNVPDSGYGGWAYQGGSTYWYWFNTGWAAVDLSKVGTGLVDPTTTKGDLIVRGASAPATRLPVGTDGQTLQADSTQALGIKWVTPPPAGVSSVFGRTGAVLPVAGDYKANMITNAVDATQSYSYPSWIAALNWGVITGAPAFLVSPLTHKGDLISYGTSPAALPIGVDGQVLTADSTQVLGIKWSTQAIGVSSLSPGSLTGAVSLQAGANVGLAQNGQIITISVPNINSSTGMSDPTTTTGDLIVHGSSGTTRLPVGNNGQYLIADSSQITGVRWATLVIPPAGVTSISPGSLTGAVSFQAGTNINISQAGQVITIGAASIGMTDPTTTQGDLIVHATTGTTRFACGTSNGMVLVTDTTQPAGLRWASGGAITAAGSDMQVQVNKAGTLGADAGFTYDYTNHNLYLNADGATQAWMVARAFSGASTGYGGQFRGYGARGSMSTPTATQAGDYLAYLTGNGYDGAAWQTAAQIAFGTLVNWTSNNGTGFIAFLTNPGGTTPTERMRITNAGLVGIGTSSPDSPLVVQGANNYSGGRGQFAVNDSATAMTFRLGAGTDGTNKVVWLQATETGVSNARNIALNPIAGSVGIGTTVPMGALDVSMPFGSYSYIHGNSNGVQPSTSFQNGLAFTWNRSGGNAEANLIFNGSSLEIGYWSGSAYGAEMTITSGGNVGIGTTSPQTLLTVNGNIRMSGWRSTLFYHGDGTDSGGLQLAGGDNTGVLVITPTTDSGAITTKNIMFGGGGAGIYNTLSITVAVSGNLAVGAYAPTNQSQLYVKWGANSDSTGQIGGSWGAIVYNANNGANFNGLLVKNNWAATNSTVFAVGTDYVGGAFNPYLTVLGNGQVGIGTASPGAGLLLDVQGGNSQARVFSTAGGNTASLSCSTWTDSLIMGVESSAGQQLVIGSVPYGGVLNMNAAYPLHFATNNSVRMTITSAGYLGINDNGAAALLSVNGGYGPDAASSNFFKVFGGTLPGSDSSEIFLASFGALTPNVSKFNISARRNTSTNDWPHNDFVLSHSVDIYPRVAGSYIVLSGNSHVFVNRLTDDGTGAVLQVGGNVSANGVILGAGGGGNIQHAQVFSGSVSAVTVTLPTAGYWKITASIGVTMPSSATATWGISGVGASPATISLGPMGAANCAITSSWSWIVNVSANAVASMTFSGSGFTGGAIVAHYLGTT